MLCKLFPVKQHVFLGKHFAVLSQHWGLEVELIGKANEVDWIGVDCNW